jgi:cytoskeletal protein CcmA (bactofilin family)
LNSSVFRVDNFKNKINYFDYLCSFSACLLITLFSRSNDGNSLLKFPQGVNMTNQPESFESVVIGDGVIVKGTFTVPAKAVVNGVIEGDLTAEEVLVGPTGKITGRVSAKVLDVRGELHNTIISEKSLIIRSTGKIAGKVQYVEIEIEKGGEVEGTLTQSGPGAPIALPPSQTVPVT